MVQKIDVQTLRVSFVKKTEGQIFILELLEDMGKEKGKRFYFLRLPATSDNRVLEVTSQRLRPSQALETLSAQCG